MTAIWQHDEGGWRLLFPSGFPDEATLHSLVEEAPHTLPLAGEPRLTILGREVFLGGNAADLVAVEQSGRLAIIEIKLARNAEARRAVIAQILTYAAYLRGLDVASLERDVLARPLRQRGFESVAQAVSARRGRLSHGTRRQFGSGTVPARACLGRCAHRIGATRRLPRGGRRQTADRLGDGGGLPDWRVPSHRATARRSGAANGPARPNRAGGNRNGRIPGSRSRRLRGAD